MTIFQTTNAFHRGGSLVSDFQASDKPALKAAQIVAAVRSTEQAEALSKEGIDVLQLDLADEKAVVETVLQRKSMGSLFVSTNSSRFS
jgi:saccharopine dehydrogenase-like NADP-dependent oxidoreductase